MGQTYTSSGVSIWNMDTYSGLYACPASTTALVNSVYFCNRNIETGIATAVNLRFYDSSTSNYISIVSGVNLPGQASIQPISAPLVLKAGDSLQVAERSGFADVTASIMEIT